MAKKELHAIVLPFPAQGHVTPMFQLALKLLRAEGGFSTISFINTDYDHERILANGHSHDLLHLPGLRLLTLPDGLPPGHGRINDPGPLQVFCDAIDSMYGPLQNLIQATINAASSGQSCPPVTCIIADIFFSNLMGDVAEMVGLPWIAFWSNPMHANLVYCSMSDLLAKGILPIDCQDVASTNQVIDCVMGVPPFKACDLPCSLQPPGGSPDAFFFRWFLDRNAFGVPQRANCHLINSVDDLDKEATWAFEKLVGKCLTVGPLLPLEFFSGNMAKVPQMGTSLWAEDDGCKEWLDMQEEHSVLYVSFGSIVCMARQQVEEVANGLEASGRPFLWVMRLDVDVATLAELEAFKVRTRQRGLVVTWAPQLLVLSHPSIAAFLTHCGWNSILESISSGIPMLAWPGGFAEQKMNATYITSIWKIALGFRHELTEGNVSIVTRGEIKKVIESVMSVCKQSKTLKERCVHLQKIVRDSLLSTNGSSQAHFQSFLEAVTHLKSNFV